MAHINDYFNETARKRFVLRAFDEGPRLSNTRKAIQLPATTPTSPWIVHLEAPQVGGEWLTLPDGWTYVRASNDETVQTSESTIVSGIATNVARVGRSSSSKNFGLVIEFATTNLIGASWRNADWNFLNGSQVTYSASGVTGPDGAGTPKQVDVLTNGYSDYYSVGGPSQFGALTAWMRSPVSMPTSSWQMDSASITGGFTAYGTLNSTWQRVGGGYTAPTTNIGMIPLDARNQVTRGGTTAGARNAIIDFLQLEQLPYQTEVTGGSRAQDILTALNVHNNGKMSFYIKFRPKMSNTQLVNTTDNDVSIIYSDLDNRIVFTKLSRKITVFSGGSFTQFANAVPTWNADDIIELAIECGGGTLTTGTVWINDSPTILGTSVLPHNNWNVDAATIMYGHPTDIGCFSSWIEEVGFYV